MISILRPYVGPFLLFLSYWICLLHPHLAGMTGLLGIGGAALIVRDIERQRALKTGFQIQAEQWRERSRAFQGTWTFIGLDRQGNDWLVSIRRKAHAEPMQLRFSDQHPDFQALRELIPHRSIIDIKLTDEFTAGLEHTVCGSLSIGKSHDLPEGRALAASE